MRCFNHSSIESVALCKHCGRGLCHECTAEVGTVTACRGRCEEAVARMNDLIERSQTVYPKTASTYVRAGVFTILMGLCFSWFGIGPLLDGDASSASYTFAALGALFVGWGVLQFGMARKWLRK